MSETLAVEDAERSKIQSWVLKLEPGYWICKLAGSEPKIIYTPLLSTEDKHDIERDILSIDGMDNKERALVEHILHYPFISIGERCSRLGWSKREIYRIIQRLEERDIIEKIRIGTGRGRPKTFLSLTKRWLNSHSLESDIWKKVRSSSFTHAYLVNLVSKTVGGKPEWESGEDADIVLYREGKRIAIEVIVTNYKISKVIERRKNYDMVIFLALDRFATRKIRGVQLFTVKEFIKNWRRILDNINS